MRKGAAAGFSGQFKGWSAKRGTFKEKGKGPKEAVSSVVGLTTLRTATKEVGEAKGTTSTV